LSIPQEAATELERLKQIDSLFRTIKQDFPKELGHFINFTQGINRVNALDRKQKDLILVALAVSSKCDWCVEIHIKNAVENMATKAEILEAAMMAVIMGGAPQLMYMNVVYDILAKHFD
jgi:AhpD family alkylhydroperoxidase